MQCIFSCVDNFSLQMQQTALHYAIQEENFDVVQYLVDIVGVDIHQADEVT